MTRWLTVLVCMAACVYVQAACFEDMVPMRDGVRLYTRAVTPDGDGKHPCVFKRTPYPRGDELKVPYPASAAAANRSAKRGYVEVVQHCRGFGRSEGFCRVYVEREDGLDTLDWIRRQPWYNGEIFLEGGSYTTSVHLLYLGDEPPDVKGAAFAIQTDRMYFRNYRNGCNYAWCNFSWWKSMVAREFPQAKGGADVIRRPYRDIALRAFGKDMPAYTGFLMHTENDAFWTADARTEVMSHIKFPVLWNEGWWDFYIEGMTSMWERMLPEWKAKSVYVVGPGGHGGNAIKGTPIPQNHIASGCDALDFFDAVRAGKTYAPAETGKVRAYSVGADEWRSLAWPRAAAEVRTFALGADGSLVEGASASAGTVAWTYDPHVRLPGFPDTKCVRAFAPGTLAGAQAFTSKPFEQETAFFGKPRIRLPVSSDCDDTQFFFRIDLVAPDGSAWNLTQTISTLRHAHADYKAGQTVELDLEFPLIAFTVKKGWGVRLDATSEGGVYVPHANVAKHWAEVTEDEVRIARNSIHCGRAILSLPIQ